MRCTKLILLAAAAHCLLFLSAGCGARTPNNAGSSQDDLEAVTVINLRDAERGLQRTTTQPATVHGFHEANIYAQVSGYLAELKADIGDRVKKDELLARIDLPEMEKAKASQEAAVQQHKAMEEQAKAKKNLAQSAIEAAEAMKKQAAADVAKEKAEYTAEKLQFDRTKGLVDKGTYEKKLLDEAQKKLDSAKAAKDSAAAALEAESAKCELAKSQFAAAKADVTVAFNQTIVAQKKLEEIAALMDFAELRAPFDGVVVDRNVDEGDLVRNMRNSSGKSDQPLFVIAQVKKLRVRIAVPENEAPFAKVGNQVTLKLRSLPGKTFIKNISRISASLDPSTQTMIAEVDLDNDGSLFPGMYGEATIVLEDRPKAIVLPAPAVRHDEKGKSFVYVLNSEDKVAIVDVVTGVDNGKKIEIVEGLDGTERVVGPSIGRLQANQKVRVIQEKTSK